MAGRKTRSPLARLLLTAVAAGGLLAGWIGVLAAQKQLEYWRLGRQPFRTNVVRMAVKDVVSAGLDPYYDARLLATTSLPLYDFEMSPRRLREWHAMLRRVRHRGTAAVADRIYLPAELRVAGEVYDVDVRGRGLLVDHYQEAKPSFRVRFKKDRSFDGRRVINLVHPYDKARLVGDTTFNEMARQLDLLTYPTRFAVVRLNDRVLGVYQDIDHFRQELGVLARRSEGYFVNARGQGKGGAEEVVDPGFRGALAAFGEFAERCADEPALTRRTLERYLDGEKLAAFLALTTLFGSGHAWNADDLMLFFDPARGRFEPVPWDVGIRSLASLPPVDGATDQAQLETTRGVGLCLLADPELRQRRDEILWAVVHRQIEPALASAARQWEALEPEIAFDVQYSRRRSARIYRNFRTALAGNAEILRAHLASRRGVAERLQPSAEETVAAARPSAAVPAGIEATASGWRFSGRVRLEETLVLPEGAPAIFAPGLDLALAPGVDLVLRGDLWSVGTEARPIVVGADDPKAPFGIVAVIGKAHRPAKVVIRHSEISGGSEGGFRAATLTGMLSIYDGDLSMADSVIRDARGEDALNVKYGRVDIRGSRFSDHPSDAIDLDFCRGTFVDNRVERAVGDGLDASGSTLEVRANVFVGIDDKAISVGEDSRVLLEGNRIDGATTGVAVKDRSRVFHGAGELRQVEAAFAIYQKKPAFGSGTLEVAAADVVEASTELVADPAAAWLEPRLWRGPLER